MKTLTIFILSLFTIALLSYTPQQTTVIKTVSEKPKHTIVKSYSIYNRDEMIQYINSCTKDGYIVKSINGAGADSWWFVTLEKYK
ncbi:hypothetical protein M2T79_09330 [Elizabethkingia miricola]|uniref:hypothetical protein n=1 Tax=Elizabethkingia miricola TaxID=172045 RepID=UPI002019FA3C|nr:hypothetical protein [Elizabethkingia miricola]MCL1656800.1 hypothetical protein [Elizabethkingia miricola]